MAYSLVMNLCIFLLFSGCIEAFVADRPGLAFTDPNLHELLPCFHSDMARSGIPSLLWLISYAPRPDEPVSDLKHKMHSQFSKILWILMASAIREESSISLTCRAAQIKAAQWNQLRWNRPQMMWIIESQHLTSWIMIFNLGECRHTYMMLIYCCFAIRWNAPSSSILRFAVCCSALLLISKDNASRM